MSLRKYIRPKTPLSRLADDHCKLNKIRSKLSLNRGIGKDHYERVTIKAHLPPHNTTAISYPKSYIKIYKSFKLKETLQELSIYTKRYSVLKKLSVPHSIIPLSKRGKRI